MSHQIRSTREITAVEDSTAAYRRFVTEPVGLDDLPVLRACPIELLRGLLPSGAPDAVSISRCHDARLVVLAGADPVRRWVLTHRGQLGLARSAPVPA